MGAEMSTTGALSLKLLVTLATIGVTSGARLGVGDEEGELEGVDEGVAEGDGVGRMAWQPSRRSTAVTLPASSAHVIAAASKRATRLTRTETGSSGLDAWASVTTSSTSVDSLVAAPAAVSTSQ